MSILVVSFVLMTCAVLAGESGFQSVVGTMDLENRLAASHAARSCASAAILLIAQDSSYGLYGGNEELKLAEGQICTIEEVYEENGSFSVTGSAVVGNSVSRVRIEGTLSSSSTVSITKWQDY